MLLKALISAGLVSAGLILILLTTTTPSSSGALGILAVFVLSYIVFLVLTTFTLWTTSFLMTRLTKNLRSNRHTEVVTLRRAYYFSTIIALAPVLMVSLRSVGAVGPYEVGLIALFVALGCLYVARRTT